MSTALRLSTFRSGTSHRGPILAAVSALVAAAAISVTLAVTGNGSDAASVPASAGAAPAAPDRATLYRNGAVLPGNGAINGKRSAERFHHFR